MAAETVGTETTCAHLRTEIDGLERLADDFLGGDPKRMLLASVARLRALVPPRRQTEYRVVEERGGQLVERYGGGDLDRPEAERLAQARGQAEHLKHFAITNVRVQKRTVTRTPWEDVPDA